MVFLILEWVFVEMDVFLVKVCEMVDFDMLVNLVIFFNVMVIFI